jgi:hypothetical protein
MGEMMETHHCEKVSCYEMFIHKAADVGWIELVQEMERWRALKTAVKNLRVP